MPDSELYTKVKQFNEYYAKWIEDGCLPVIRANANNGCAGYWDVKAIESTRDKGKHKIEGS